MILQPLLDGIAHVTGGSHGVGKGITAGPGRRKLPTA